MLFAYDTECSLRSAVALVNSAVEPDTLTTVEQLDAWYAEHGFTGRHDSDDAELTSVRALRPVLRELLTAERDRAAELVNQLLAEAQAVPQLRRHDGLDWHIHAVPSDAPLARRIVVEVAMAMIDLIRTDELSRLACQQRRHSHRRAEHAVPQLIRTGEPLHEGDVRHVGARQTLPAKRRGESFVVGETEEVRAGWEIGGRHGSRLRHRVEEHPGQPVLRGMSPCREG